MKVREKEGCRVSLRPYVCVGRCTRTPEIRVFSVDYANFGFFCQFAYFGAEDEQSTRTQTCNVSRRQVDGGRRRRRTSAPVISVANCVTVDAIFTLINDSGRGRGA